MVEKNPNATTQLPSSDSLHGQLLMHGDVPQFKRAIAEMLSEADLNELELQLLDKYLDKPQDCAAKVCEVLKKAQARLVDHRRSQKVIRKVLPLFDKHDFWHTQPVTKIYEPIQEGFNTEIETKTLKDVQVECYQLPESYEWCNVDIKNPEQAQELYELLSNHYVEDDGGNFRFDYSVEFLTWALSPPNYKPDWLVGVRGGKKKRLFGFISGIPIHIRTLGKTQVMAEINFLCVHKQLRSHRLAPVLIKEITRRVNRCDIWQAVYTSGTTLPTPFGSAPYWHRNLNPKKTVEVGFAFKPPEKNLAAFIKMHRLPEEN